MADGGRKADGTGRGAVPSRWSDRASRLECHAANRTQPLVLIVDDDTAASEGLASLLESRYDLVMAKDAAHALAIARELVPDLILLDRFLEEGDGLAVLEQLQNDPRTDTLPVIFVTGDADEKTLERCLELGAVDFLQKPANPRELLARIGRALRTSEQRKVLQTLAQTDALTGLANYRSLSLRLDEEFKRAVRYKYSLSVVMIDLDHLKAINDGLGHDVGNRAIFALAGHLRNNLREVDFAARFGGDEFVVLLPHQTAHEAAIFAERIRAGLRTVEVQRADGRPAPFGLSMSVGIADHSTGTPRETVDDLVKEADSALYEAKRGGRDRVVVHGVIPAPVAVASVAQRH